MTRCSPRKSPASGGSSGPPSPRPWPPCRPATRWCSGSPTGGVARAAHVLTTINELRDHGVTEKSLTENFDLDTKEGRLMFAVPAAAEYELELHAERQAEGISAARRRQAAGTMLPGKKHIGRPG